MAEEIVINLEVDNGGSGAKSLSSLKKEFKELQSSLDNVEVGTKEYIDTLKKLGSVKDEIGDLRSEIDAFAGNDKKVAAFGNVINGVAGGFSAVTGAMGLLGAESEDTQEALLKVQSALALSQGISSVVELGDSFKVLGNIIKANPLILLATVVVGVVTAFVGLDDIIGGIKAGFVAMGEAVSAAFDFIVDGIMTAIDLYTQYLDILTFGLFDLNASYKGYIENIEEANRKERERIEGINQQIEASKKLVAETEKQIEANKKIIAQIEERRGLITKAYDQEIALAQAAGKETEKLESEKLEFVRKSLQEEIKVRLENFKLIQKIADEQIKQAELASQKNNIFEEKSANIRAESAKERKRLQEQSIKELEAQLETTNNTIAVKEVEAETKRREQGQAAYEERLKQQEDYLERAKALEELYAQEDRKAREKAQKEYLESLKAVKDEEVQINFDALEENVKVNEAKSVKDIQASAEEFKNFKLVQDAKVQMLSDTLTTLSSLTDLFGKKNEANAKRAFEINKALSIADAIIKTYQSANAIFASAAANPSTVLFPAQPFITAGLAIVAGLGNVARISQTKFGGGASGGGAPSVPSLGGGGGSAPSTGSGNQVNSTLLDRESIESGQNQNDSRVYVVETDITQTQKRVSGIERRAVIQ